MFLPLWGLEEEEVMTLSGHLCSFHYSGSLAEFLH